MASNQPTQAVIVVPNDDINIPEPGSYKGGTNNGAGVNLSVPVGSGNFVSGDLNPAGTGYSNRVTGGDVAYEPSTGTIAQVIEVTGEDTLTLSAPGLTGGGAAFELYRGNGGKVNNKQGNEGFSLFVGTAGDVVGKGKGYSYGPAFKFEYVLLVPVKGREIKITFDDWIFKQDDRVAINRATMTKFGFKVAELTVVFVKD